MECLTGKKTILFPVIDADIDYIERLNTQGSGATVMGINGITGRSTGWVAQTKEGRPRNIGCILFSVVSPISLLCHILLDTKFADGLQKRLYNHEYTYAQDAVITTTDFVLAHNGFYRMEISVFPGDTMALMLLSNSGFQTEGKMRNCYQDNNGMIRDVLIMSRIKEIDKLNTQEVTDGIQPIKDTPAKEGGGEQEGSQEGSGGGADNSGTGSGSNSEVKQTTC